jgi:hypothetical protein
MAQILSHSTGNLFLTLSLVLHGFLGSATLWRMPGDDIAVIGNQQPQRRFIIVARGLAISPFGYEE